MLQQMRNSLQNAKRVALFSHVSPDMDTLGSSLGAAILLRRGFCVPVTLFCEDAVPRDYTFIEREGKEFTCPTGEEEPFDVAIAIDVPTPERLGERCLPVFLAAKERYCIDHHSTNTMAQLCPTYLDASAPACAELIVRIAGLWGVEEFPAWAAECLYAGLSTDSGNFSFEAVREETFLAAAKLVRSGADPNRITERLYRTNTLTQLHLLGHTLNTMELYEDGKIALLKTSKAEWDALGAQDGDHEGLVNWGLRPQSVLVSAYLAHRPQGIRCSVRTKPPIDATKIAQRFGGGGHERASGMSFNEQSFEEATAALLAALKEAVN